MDGEAYPRQLPRIGKRQRSQEKQNQKLCLQGNTIKILFKKIFHEAYLERNYMYGLVNCFFTSDICIAVMKNSSGPKENF